MKDENGDECQPSRSDGAGIVAAAAILQSLVELLLFRDD